MKQEFELFLSVKYERSHSDLLYLDPLFLGQHSLSALALPCSCRLKSTFLQLLACLDMNSAHYIMGRSSINCLGVFLLLLHSTCTARA